jgi:hypothetical protein
VNNNLVEMNRMYRREEERDLLRLSKCVFAFRLHPDPWTGWTLDQVDGSQGDRDLENSAHDILVVTNSSSRPLPAPVNSLQPST